MRLRQPDFGFAVGRLPRDDGFRAAQHAWTLARLAEAGVTPLVVDGSVPHRLQQVLQHIRRHDAAVLAHIEKETSPS